LELLDANNVKIQLCNDVLALSEGTNKTN